jgi:hypothetical protein
MVLDDEVVAQVGNEFRLSTTESGICFLDPFTVGFLNWVRSIPRDQAFDAAQNSTGLPTAPLDFNPPDAISILSAILESFKQQIRSPLGDKEYEKVAWLYDRIAKRLGVPPASSYPRVRPASVG